MEVREIFKSKIRYISVEGKHYFVLTKEESEFLKEYFDVCDNILKRLKISQSKFYNPDDDKMLQSVVNKITLSYNVLSDDEFKAYKKVLRVFSKKLNK